MKFIPTFENNLATVLFFVLAFFALIQLVYTFYFHARLAFRKTKDANTVNLPPVSVIIAARNEADNLYEHLPAILEQDYPEFEVIIVNHQSWDETKHIVNAYHQTYPFLRGIEVAKSPHLRPGKKLALTIGIKGAKYEHLLFTDADCKPTSRQWIRSMAGHFTTKESIVLGYGPYNRKKGFLNTLIRFDTAWIGLNYLSFALAKMPYMGVGRNLAYTKSDFERTNGFKSHYALPSGDDDLFIQEAAKKSNYTINISSESFCFSEPHQDWASWIRQKTRHYSTSSKYKVIKKALLGIYPLSLLIMFVSFVILMWNHEFRWLALSVFLFVFILKWWIQGRAIKKLGEKDLIMYLPFLDLFYAVLIPTLYYSTEKKGTNKW